jgi:alpha-D-ribose 1-methylphosphonate 5-triphosphate diphosphatase PhnM
MSSTQPSSSKLPTYPTTDPAATAVPKTPTATVMGKPGATMYGSSLLGICVGCIIAKTNILVL